jgi:hypothetical protein
MIDSIYSAWSSFIEDIGVSPPNIPSSVAVEKQWCPEGTKDPKRLTEKRPLLKKLLFSALEGNVDVSEYPDNWRQRKSFGRLLNQCLKQNHSKHDFNKWVKSNIDASALELIHPEHHHILEERFNELVIHLSEIRDRAGLLNIRYRERKQEIQDRLKVFIKMKTGPGHSNRMKNIQRYESEIVKPMGDALIVMKSVERALIEDMQEMVLDAMNRSLGDVNTLLSLPSIDGLLSMLELMPDFKSEDGLQQFEEKNTKSAIASALSDYQNQIAELTYSKTGIEKHLQEFKISLQNDGGINFMQNIVTGDGNKIAQANQTTNLSTSKDDSD